jgi:hypothetical protein
VLYSTQLREGLAMLEDIMGFLTSAVFATRIAEVPYLVARNSNDLTSDSDKVLYFLVWVKAAADISSGIKKSK